MLEFALSMPLLILLGMYGVEVAYMSSVDMQMSQIATAVADNASRLEQTNNGTVAPTVTEADVDSVMFGVQNQGKAFKFEERGRVLLSSLEKDPNTGKQFIHWQRCVGGAARHKSSYGDDGPRNGLNGGSITSMGRGTTKVKATGNVAVMFAEVYYDHQPLFGTLFVNNRTFKHEAAFVVRDQRDLRNPNQPGLTGSSNKSKCA